MGFKIKLHNISVTNDFRVFYRKGRTPGSSSIQSGDWGINGGIFVGDFISSVNSVDIDIENIEYGSQYWVKILDVVTGSYIIENIYVHEFEFYRFCETCCDLSGGTATFISFDVDCTFTGGSAIFGENTPTPTPTPTPITPTPTPTPTSTTSCEFGVDVTLNTPTPTPTPTDTNACTRYTLTYDSNTLPIGMSVRYSPCNGSLTDKRFDQIISRDNGDGTITAVICTLDAAVIPVPICIQNHNQVECPGPGWVNEGPCDL